MAECRLHLLWVHVSDDSSTGWETRAGKKQQRLALNLRSQEVAWFHTEASLRAARSRTFTATPLVFQIPRAPPRRAPIVYRNLIMVRRGHVKFMRRLHRCNDQISPWLTRLNLSFVVRLSRRVGALDRSSIDGFKFETILVISPGR